MSKQRLIQNDIRFYHLSIIWLAPRVGKNNVIGRQDETIFAAREWCFFMPYNISLID